MEYFDDDIPEAIEDPFADETGNPQNSQDEDEKTAKKPKKKRVGTGPRSLQEKHLLHPKTGLLALPKHFLNNAGEIKHWEEGKELENINEFMYHIERWAHNMYPKWQLDHCLEKIERLGAKMPIKTAMTKLREGDEMFAFELEQQFEEEQKQIQAEKDGATLNEENVNQYYNPDLMQPSGYGINTEKLHKKSAPAVLDDEMQRKIAENRRKALERKKQREAEKANQMVTNSQDEL